MTYNVILFTDIPNPDHLTRGYGAYRLASEIRKHGYSVLTVDFSSIIDVETFTKIIEHSVGVDTICVGFSTTWFPYNKPSVNKKYMLGPKSRMVDPKEDFDVNTQPWYFNSVTHKVSSGELYIYRDIVKRVNNKCKIIIGGAKSNEYINEPACDNVFIGYSENQMIDYLHSLSGKGMKRIFNKVIDYDVKATNGSFVFNNSPTVYVDSDLIMSEELMTIEFSRGCIFNCIFCSFPHRNSDTRDFVKYKEVIYNELMDNYNKWGIYKYTITDDTFNDHTEKLILINEVIQSLPFKPIFSWAFARLDLVSRNPEQAQLMKDIGVKEVYYGLETMNDSTAKVIRKGGKLEKKIEGMKIAKDCWGEDVMISVGIVVGLPKETIASLNYAVEWYISEGHKYIDNFKFTDLHIFPDDGYNQYKFLSDIESDPVKYGYSFPDSVNRPFDWELTDGEITSKSLAIDLVSECNTRTKPYSNRTTVKGEWNSSYKSYDISINDGSSQAYYEYVSTYYLPRLLKFLNIQ